MDIDSGTAEGDDAAEHQDAAALSWLRAELSAGPLLDRLRRRFRIDKRLAVDPKPPRAFAWDRWQPGDKVCWEAVFPESAPLAPVDLAGRTFRLQEWYCANPECHCHDVALRVIETLPDGKERLVGNLKVDFRDVILLDLTSAEEQAAVPLAEVWAALKTRHDIASYFSRRHRVVQAAASVGVRRSQRGPTAPPPKRLDVPRNAPCPCGSGLKYKRCCLGKEDPQSAAENGDQAASRGDSRAG